MNKRKLLYASPFPPIKSGISDYSQILVYGLRAHFDVSLSIDRYRLAKEDLYRDFEVIADPDGIDFGRYDHILYSFGNNWPFHGYIYDMFLRHRGSVILHDFVIYYLTAGYYRGKSNFYSKIYEIGGAKAIHFLKRMVKNGEDVLSFQSPEALPLNREVIDHADRIFVHSEFSRNRVLQVKPEAKVHKINMVDLNRSPVSDRPIDRGYLQRAYGIEDDAFVIGSFGYVQPTKRNREVCDAVKRILECKKERIYYVMVGEGDYIEEFLGPNILKTGYVPMETYCSVLARCDMVASLRYPSMGETSISLIHAMGMGKPCLVSDLAWFSELPDEVVIKLDPRRMTEELFEKIDSFLSHPSELEMIGKRAKEYVREEHDPTRTALQIASRLMESA